MLSSIVIILMSLWGPTAEAEETDQPIKHQYSVQRIWKIDFNYETDDTIQS